jgi:hypothetical protein
MSAAADPAQGVCMSDKPAPSKYCRCGKLKSKGKLFCDECLRAYAKLWEKSFT